MNEQSAPDKLDSLAGYGAVVSAFDIAAKRSGTWRLAQVRNEQDITQKAVAAAMGVKQPRISEIENGDLGSVTITTLRTYASALGGTLRIAVDLGDREYVLADARREETVADESYGSTIAELGGILSNSASVNDGMRDVFEFITEYDAADLRLRAALLADPAQAEDEHWDSLLAALAEHLALRDGLEPPAWTAGHHLATAWFPYNTALARCDAIVHAPGAFKVRNVFLSARELEHA